MNTNLDYDIEQFSGKKHFSDKPESYGSAKASLKKKKIVIRNPASMLIIVVMAVLVACIFYNGAILNEMSMRLAETEKSLRTMKEDENILDVQISQLVDLNMIEEYAAEELGMKKIEKNQVNFVDLSGEEYTVRLDRNDGKKSVSTFLNGIISSLNVILGYLN